MRKNATRRFAVVKETDLMTLEDAKVHIETNYSVDIERFYVAEVILEARPASVIDFKKV